MFWRPRRRQAQPFVYQPDNSSMTGQPWPDLTGNNSVTGTIPLAEDTAGMLVAPQENEMVPLLAFNPDLRIFYLIVLDASDSMTPFRETVVEAYNAGLLAMRNGLANQVGPANVEMALQNVRIGLASFNSRITRIHGYKPLSRAPQLAFDQYVPDGSTALYTTVHELLGSTYNMLKKEYAGRVSFAVDIYTDGEDNSSRPSDDDRARSVLQLIRGLRPGPHTSRITGFGNNAEQAKRRMGFDHVRNMGFTAQDIQHTMTTTGQEMSTEFTNSLTRPF